MLVMDQELVEIEGIIGSASEGILHTSSHGRSASQQPSNYIHAPALPAIGSDARGSDAVAWSTKLCNAYSPPSYLKDTFTFVRYSSTLPSFSCTILLCHLGMIPSVPRPFSMALWRLFKIRPLSAIFILPTGRG